LAFNQVDRKSKALKLDTITLKLAPQGRREVVTIVSVVLNVYCDKVKSAAEEAESAPVIDAASGPSSGMGSRPHSEVQGSLCSQELSQKRNRYEYR
jgi:hypothetical protein